MSDVKIVLTSAQSFSTSHWGSHDGFFLSRMMSGELLSTSKCSCAEDDTRAATKRRPGHCFEVGLVRHWRRLARGSGEGQVPAVSYAG